MNILIVHLTDIHFTIKTDLSSRIHAFCQAFHKDILGSKNLYFVVSGDIALEGKKEEYEKAKSFFSNIKLFTEGQFPGISIKFIFVPGNHDCNFDKETQIRKNSIPDINYKYLGNDNSVVDICLSIQSEFWDFFSKFQGLPSNKLYYQIKDTVGTKTIVFHCINTAWISQLKELTGSLFFPTQHFEIKPQEAGYLHFGIWHHPYNWFNPNTTENNKKEFEKFTESLASTHFFGHEHESSVYANENKVTSDKINLLSGELFNDDRKRKVSGFQTVSFDIVTNKGTLKRYSFEGERYASNGEFELDLNREVQKSFKQNAEFIKVLEEVKIPLVIEGRKEIRQSEIFVWPDMEPISSDLSFDSYQNTQKILDEDCKSCVLDGESQIGKTTLLSMLYVSLYDRGKVPVLLRGKDISEPNVAKIVKRHFRHQYSETPAEYDKFAQLSNHSRVLLIDDFHETGFNTSATKIFMEEALKMFGKVILVFDSASMMMPSSRAEFHGVHFYTLRPLGYKKRNELIERYQLLKENPYTMNEQEFIEGVKTSFDNVQAILGDKLMPSFPLYVLSILQALEYKPLKQNETSYGYCYQTLIHYSLHKAGIQNDDLDAYINFLTELAYFFIIDDVESKAVKEVNQFHLSYSDKYICPSYETMIRTLKKSKILQEENGIVKFGYCYILYYLSAKRIADEIHAKEGQIIVEALFKELHKERNANILVFITHHSRDFSFIENCLLNSMIQLDKNSPITLERNDPFYSEISMFAEGLREEILETNRNPRDEREKMLLRQDEDERVLEYTQQEILDKEFAEMKAISLPFQQAFRSIEIVGQIIKNRKGSLPKTKLVEIISELYTTGFRTISYVSDLLVSSRREIIDYVNEETQNSENRAEVENEINNFIQVISLEACLSVFNKLILAAGNKDLKPLYNNVAEKLNTPASKLVTFGINSYYGTISAEEVRALAEEFKNNQVALKLLRGRVKHYVYNKNPSYKIKQQFASILGMQLGGIKQLER